MTIKIYARISSSLVRKSTLNDLHLPRRFQYSPGTYNFNNVYHIPTKLFAYTSFSKAWT